MLRRSHPSRQKPRQGAPHGCRNRIRWNAFHDRRVNSPLAHVSRNTWLAHQRATRNTARMQSRPLARRPFTQPHPARLPESTAHYDEILARHAAALDVGDAGYPDPATGLFVLTAGFLAERGTCCDNGCRHCPYVE